MTRVRIEISGADEFQPGAGRRGDAGIDLRAARGALLAPGERAAISAGVRLALPPGTVGLIRDRSGLALEHGVHVLAGVIDANYRGEIRIVLVNLGTRPFRVEKGDRVAQLLVLICPEVELKPVRTLDETGRGEDGFGSSGVK